MISKRTTVEGLGLIVQSDGDLYTNVKDLKGRLISISNEAHARIYTDGEENIGAKEGTRTAVELDYIKGDAPVALKYDKLSPAIAKRAVEANSKGKYSCTNSTKRYDANRKIADREESSGISYKNRRAIVLPREDFNMSPSENSSKFAFFFKEMAEEEGKNSYFAFNKKLPIGVYLINKDIIDGKKDSKMLENPNGTIVVPYMWFRGLDGRSELGGCGIAGDGGGGARGVFGAPKAPQKISETNSQRVLPYTTKQIERELNRLSKLEAEIQKSREFLTSIKQ